MTRAVLDQETAPAGEAGRVRRPGDPELLSSPAPRPAGERFRWDRLSQEEAAVLRAIIPQRGKARAVQVGEISKRAGVPSRRAQDLVKALIEVHHVPIGTSRSAKRPGWYLCATVGELRAMHEVFHGQALKLLARSRAFNPAGNPFLAAEFYGQQQLPLQGGQRG